MGERRPSISTSLAMLALLSAGAAFAPPTPSRCSSSAIGRREFAQTAGAALAALPGFAAFADGANSAATVTRARSIYGSRIFRLQKATPDEVVSEANVFTLFVSGAYRSADNKKTAAELKSISKKILAAAKAGDDGATKASLKEFIALGKIEKELDQVPGNNWDPRQRRNAGAPPTSEIEAQMGTEAYALYAPLKSKYVPLSK